MAGGAEWVVEAYARFGGIASRLHAAGAEQGGFGLHFALPDELRALNGPTLCRPCTDRRPVSRTGPVVVPAARAGGARRPGRAGRAVGPSLSSVLLPAVCGLCVAAQYLFMINYAAPRFLLPAYALLAVPAADGLAFLITGLGRELRPAMTAAVTCFLVVQLLGQHLVLDHEAGGTVTFHDDYTRIATALAARGVRPPCLISGVQYIPIAFYAGCASAGTAAPGDHVALLIRPAGGRRRTPGTGASTASPAPRFSRSTPISGGDAVTSRQHYACFSRAAVRKPSGMAPLRADRGYMDGYAVTGTPS